VFLGKLSFVKIGASLAVSMDELAVKSQGTAKIVQLIGSGKAIEQ
jgi:hypothetical protein